MKRKLLVALVAILLLLSVSMVGLSELNERLAVADQSKNESYDVYVVIHLNDELEPSVIKTMLNGLQVVNGVQLCVWVGDNTTGGIMDAKARLERWIPEFSDYNIVLQCDYAFNDKYGYYEYPFWKYNNTETLSQEWYTNWYGNLSEVANKYSNVVLMVGFNEAYNHFQTKEMAQTIMKREYLTWKNMSQIPFSTEFLMPYTFWADYWSFPQNASIEADCVPFWKDYSDYIGINLWADNSPPQYGTNQANLAFERVKAVINMCEFYSEQLNKPIHINEFPAWDQATLKYFADHIMKAPNIGQVYQLWYWSGQEETHYDGWTYALYNVDVNTLNVTRGEYEWNVFTNTLKPNQ
jgi:hypothetical protein